jgi:phage/plasmid-like protein (TIGR03299 family)
LVKLENNYKNQEAEDKKYLLAHDKWHKQVVKLAIAKFNKGENVRVNVRYNGSINIDFDLPAGVVKLPKEPVRKYESIADYQYENSKEEIENALRVLNMCNDDELITSTATYGVILEMQPSTMSKSSLKTGEECSANEGNSWALRQVDLNKPQIAAKNESAWTKSGVAVTATSASDVARQAGLDWTVSLHPVTTLYQIPGKGLPMHIPVIGKQAVVKTTPTGEVTPLGIVGNKYKPLQNAEVFSVLDTLIDSGDARYAAAGEYALGAKVWMLMQLPVEMEIKGDPHAAFLLAKTTHDGSGSVLIRPIIERLFCHNQINKIYRATDKKRTYMLRHTTNSKLDVNDVRGILEIAYTTIDDYTVMSEAMLARQVSREHALDYFKKVFPLPSKIEDAPLALLSVGEKTQRTNAWNHRARSLDIYENSPTQDNIRDTAFGLWQSVIEYADHGKPRLGIRTMSGSSDNLKIRAQELALI